MASYELTNFKWGSSLLGTTGGQVTWSFATTNLASGYQYDRYIVEVDYRQVIRDAFAAWEAVANIDFVETTDSSSVGIRLGWDAIDGAFGVVGEARYSGISDINFNPVAPRYSITKAEIRFDTAETWSASKTPPVNVTSLYSVALHEIGHAIGLAHSTDTQTIMYPTNTGLSALGTGDLDGIRVIYGTPATPQPSIVKDLFAARSDLALGLAASYQTLLNGVPNEEGFKFLMDNAVATNFGAGPGPVFNAENIFINVSNSLAQGNATAKAAFQLISSGATLSAKVTSLYNAIIPTVHQKAEGLAFVTRTDGLNFYQQVAAERGVAGTDGAAIVAMASLLKITVDQNIGIGNAARDLLLATAAGNDGLPRTSTGLVHIEIADGSAFDGDDATAGVVAGSGGALMSDQEVFLLETSTYPALEFL